jgi:hypothetical protein
MESAAGREVADNGGDLGAMKIDGTPALRRRRPTARIDEAALQQATQESEMLFDMNRCAVLFTFAAFTAFPVVSALGQTPTTDPLPSWNDTSGGYRDH